MLCTAPPEVSHLAPPPVRSLRTPLARVAVAREIAATSPTPESGSPASLAGQHATPALRQGTPRGDGLLPAQCAEDGLPARSLLPATATTRMRWVWPAGAKYPAPGHGWAGKRIVGLSCLGPALLAAPSLESTMLRQSYDEEGFTND